MKAGLAAAGIYSLAGAASAQQSVYGQCGGAGWDGPTTCAAGSSCQYSNDWYSQCIPGAPAPSTTKTTLSTLTTKPPTTTTKPTTPPSMTTSSSPGGTGFPKAVGTKFNIDGATNYFAGTNCYWIGFLTYNPDVDMAFDHMKAAGLKVLRVWGFNDVNTVPSSGTVYYQHLSASGSMINTGAEGLERLDYVVSAAEARGIKLIINFVNNWDDYGGIAAYIAAFGGTHQTWFTNTAAQAQYRKYIAAVVARYKESPAVFAWELANEPRCNGCDTSVIYDWAKSTSEYIKSLDADHMVTLGDEGFGLEGDGSYPYQYGEGVDWVKNLGIPTLDFGTFHLYPSSWGTTTDWGNSWISTHAAQCVAAGKPCFFEEYGMTSAHCEQEAPWQKTSLGLRDEGMAGDAFWQFGDTLSWGQTSDDGNTIFYGSDDWTCLVTDHVAAIG